MTAEIDLTLPDGRTVTVREPGWRSADVARYYFEDGNGACDCNLALMVRAQIDMGFPEMPCGNTLQVDAIRTTP